MRFMDRLRSIRENFWYVPTVYGICAFILALLTVRLDYFMTSNDTMKKLVPKIILSDADVAQSVLSAISSSLLTITTITFSSILVVLTTFLSNFSPRTVQNFITDHSTQRVLGSFVGGFIYSVILLVMLRETKEKTSFITPTFAIIMTIICLAVFVFFVHHTSEWIQVGNLISNIAVGTVQAVHKNFEQKDTIHDRLSLSDEELTEVMKGTRLDIPAAKSGYIDFLDEQGLLLLAAERNWLIRLTKRQPDYVDEHSPLFQLWGSSSSEEKLKEELSHYVSIGPQRAPYRDMEFGLRKLSEIALRAISPAINDPNTAINAIEQIGNILTSLGKRYLPKPYRYDTNGHLRLITQQPIFRDYLYLSFYQIRHYGREDISVIRAIIKTLTLIAESNEHEIKETVWEFAEFIIEGIEYNVLLSLDLRYLNDLLLQLAKACDHAGEFNLLTKKSDASQ
ncbi:DUF2254 domain-containing protein [Priestia koreensis]|uniref:DUF2254 domain-containing protein n=1 Tax=Priestia koreensis TaxID=284581 RepID=UPI0006A9FE3C|nr:DUF2254 domain-containing protein [Priestia koreensis]